MITIVDAKQKRIAGTPLLVFDCELTDGEWRYWSTHGVTVSGTSYEPRILQHNAFELRASIDDAVDGAVHISLVLANADSLFSELERSVGWKGARITGRFLFYDLKNEQAETETIVVFKGIASAPDELTEAVCRLTFTNRMTLQRVQLPTVRIQKRCPWSFPNTVDLRRRSLTGEEDGKYSPFFPCGYSPDQDGGVGSLLDGSPFAECDYSRAQCEQRGMFSTDSMGRPTRRFGGVEYVPSTISVRTYGDKSAHSSVPTENEGRYNDCVPLIYGTGWYSPAVIFARNDGNLTHVEVLLGSGEMTGIIRVLVNGYDIPAGVAGTNMTGTGWYNTVSMGARTGGFNNSFQDESGRPLGDPYGSMAVLSVVVPNQISNGNALPKVQVLAKGLTLPTYNDSAEWQGESFTNNPAWIILDLLRRSGWSEAELDLASFSAAASYCAEPVQILEASGAVRTVSRFSCNLMVRRRRSAADLIRGVRNAAGLFLTYGADGKLRLLAEASIASQQTQKPVGSN
jgi:hypothetical protein